MLPLILISWLVFQEQPKLPEPPKELIEAAEKGDLPKLHAFSDHLAFSNPDKQGRTALVAAGEKGQKAAFTELIAIANDNVKKQFTGLPGQGQPGIRMGGRLQITLPLRDSPPSLKRFEARSKEMQCTAARCKEIGRG